MAADKNPGSEEAIEMSQTKKWGEEDFWGLGYEWDPQWILTDKQKELQTKLIELSRTTLRDISRPSPSSACSA